LSRAITKSPFLKVVAESSNDLDLSSVVENKKARWVLLSLGPDGGLPEVGKSLLTDQPSVSIIALAPDASQMKLSWTEACDCVIARASNGSPITLHWTEPRQKALPDLTLAELISIFRKGALWDVTTHSVEGVSDVKGLLSGKRVAVLVADGFEQVSVTRSLQILRSHGAQADIVSPANRRVKGWQLDNWGADFRVIALLASAKAQDFDGLLLPSGEKSVKALRRDSNATGFVKAFQEMQKPIVVLGRAIDLLVEAGIVKDYRVTSCEGLQNELEKAGAAWVSQEVVIDDNLVTSQSPGAIPELSQNIIKVFADA
jgi:protease I